MFIFNRKIQVKGVLMSWEDGERGEGGGYKNGKLNNPKTTIHVQLPIDVDRFIV